LTRKENASVPEYHLQPLTPLNQTVPLGVVVNGYDIAEVTDIALASLARREGERETFDRVAGDAGIPLPDPQRRAKGNTWSALWAGSDMWFVEAPLASHEDIAAILRDAFGESASITEQTDGWARFRVSGRIPALLERLCNVDPNHLAPGAAIRTVIGHVGVFILVDAPDRIDLLSPRSMAATLHQVLVDCAKGLGPQN
jgi:sarcosine oxidase subunit gamma